MAGQTDTAILIGHHHDAVVLAAGKVRLREGTVGVGIAAGGIVPSAARRLHRVPEGTPGRVPVHCGDASVTVHVGLDHGGDARS